MPKEDKPTLTAKTVIDLEAFAALDAALYRAGAFLARYSLPLEFAGRQEGVRSLETERRDA
jgi:hypothetical protein